MAAKLIINPTSSSRREIPLARTLLSIGRDPSNDLVLPDALVSRRHAVIECRGAQYVMRDCNSSNGSLVNGDRITEHSLKDGDLLAIGTARLLFREMAIEEPAAKVVHHPSAPRLLCPACESDYRRGDQFCRKCGQALPTPTPISIPCPACAVQVPLPANFCNACGSSLPRTSAGTDEGLEPTQPRPRALERPTPPPPDAEVASASAVGGGSSPQVIIPAAPRPSASPEPVPPPRPRPSEPVAVARPLPAPERASAPWAAEVPRAGFGPRLAAALVDAAIVGLAQAALVAPGGIYFSRTMGDASTLPTEPGFLPILLSVALVVVALFLGAGYYVYFWGVKGATPGKRLLGLQVQDDRGAVPIGPGRAALRLLGYLLSGAVLGIGFLMIAFGGDGLHDRLASTRVIRVPRPRV